MPSTKTPRTLEAGTVLTAGAADDVGSTLNLLDSYGGTLYAKVTNGVTGPTLPAQIKIEVSPNNSDWFTYAILVAGIESLSGEIGIYSWTPDIPEGVMYLRTAQGRNTGQNVTVDIYFGEIEAL
jgi:hypothetical protein